MNICLIYNDVVCVFRSGRYFNTREMLSVISGLNETCTFKPETTALWADKEINAVYIKGHSFYKKTTIPYGEQGVQGNPDIESRPGNQDETLFYNMTNLSVDIGEVFMTAITLRAAPHKVGLVCNGCVLYVDEPTTSVQSFVSIIQDQVKRIQELEVELLKERSLAGQRNG